jgi:tyrosine-protein kinase Etk/Wzc
MLNELILFLWKRKRLLIINFIIVAVIGIGYAWFIAKPEYKAQVTFLPPAGESSSPLSLMGISLPSLSEPSIMTEQIETIFNSKTIKRQIIEHFDFYTIFKLKKNVNKFELAARSLGTYVELQAVQWGSMGFEKIVSYTITCYHPSADTRLDSSVRTISMGRANRNRKFIGRQLNDQKKMLDSLQSEFRSFQISKKAYVVQEQFKLSLKTYAEIKSAAILNELKINALEREFRADLPELEELRKLQTLYNQKLSQIESENNPSVLPSLGFAVKLIPQYTNLLREMEVRNDVILMLEREHEQARLQESKNITSLVVVDPAYIPEYKARPKRVTLLAVIITVEHLFLLLLLLYQFYYSRIFKNHERVQTLLKAMKSRG